MSQSTTSARAPFIKWTTRGGTVNKMLTSSFQIGGVLGGELGLGGAGLGGAGLGGLEVLDLEVSLDLEVVSIKVSDWSDAGLGGELGGGRLEHKRRARN